MPRDHLWAIGLKADSPEIAVERIVNHIHSIADAIEMWRQANSDAYVSSQHIEACRQCANGRVDEFAGFYQNVLFVFRELARHYENGEPVPVEIMAAMNAALLFNIERRS